MFDFFVCTVALALAFARFAPLFFGTWSTRPRSLLQVGRTPYGKDKVVASKFDVYIVVIGPVL